MDPRMHELEEENAHLREQLRMLQEKYDALDASTSAKIRQLIDENEILAEANRLLMENEATFKRLNTAMNVEAPVTKIPDELLLPGKGLTTTEQISMENLHAVGNLLSVGSPVTNLDIAVTGGVDKHIVAHNWKQQRKLCALQTSAPVLDIAFNPHKEYANYFVASFMNAHHALLRLVDVDDTWHLEEIANFQDHTRHGAMRVAWSSNGELFATGSSDKSLNVYKCTNLTGSDLPVCEKIKSFYFNGTVEAITFIPASGEGVTEHELLAIAVRDDCYIHYVDCETFEKERVNMNQDGIEHVSYTIMDLRVSPSGKYLLAATDKDRHFVFAVKSNAVLRSFYGHKAGPYSQPRVVWHPSEKYVISNSEECGTIFVWCIASERVIDKIDAHDKLIRAISCAPVTSSDSIPVLLTVSYDKRLKAWHTKALDC